MKRRFAFLFFLPFMLLSGCASQHPVILPGLMSDGRTLLPNGWILSPAGTSVQVGELPLNMALSPDAKYLVVTNNGTARQELTLIETASWKVVQTLPLNRSWLGLRFLRGESAFLVSGGNDNRVYKYALSNGRMSLADSFSVGNPWPADKIWLAGIDVDEPASRLYATSRENNGLYEIDMHGKQVLRSVTLPAKPYTCLVSTREPFIFVSLWGGSAVAVLDRNTLSTIRTIAVGDHPNDMVESPDGSRLFVANGNSNTVSVIDCREWRVAETITTSLVPNAPEGSTPNALALDREGQHLFVANADNNCVACFGLSTSGQSKALGFIPVGWYPTCVRVLSATRQLVVANAKGMASAPDPRGPNPEKPRRDAQYIGSMLSGTVSRVDIPGGSEWQAVTAQVYANSPYVKRSASTWETSPDNPVAHRGGQPSPIKHVFYVIKENRTYDQVFGDMPEGNGDPSLCLFPEEITPNHHALAREFVLLDNLYCDAEVSADGHNWSMGAYATDYVEKSWPTSYGGRGGTYEYEGGVPIVYPSAGYLWDNCSRHGVTYRTYGEFARNGATPLDSSTATIPSLEGHVAPFYRGWDLTYSDVQRFQDWTVEFEHYEETGDLPSLQIIKLPNDHTEGTRKGSLTPRAFVGQNDLALGMLVDRISHSRYWKECAIFVIEDDAQNGPDHIDAHRTVALVISPYVKRHFVDSELYSTSSMVGTMELILGLPFLSQFDAAARPMSNAFTSVPDTSAYTCRHSRIDLNERNPQGAFGQTQSGQMDFSREDAAPEMQLSEIVWKSIRGVDSRMPAPVHSAFVRSRPQAHPEGDESEP
jgi:YVTN family beta-propeller protein